MPRRRESAEKKRRYQVTLEPRVAEHLRKFGVNNLSRGISWIQTNNTQLQKTISIYEAALRGINQD